MIGKIPDMELSDRRVKLQELVEDTGRQTYISRINGFNIALKNIAFSHSGKTNSIVQPILRCNPDEDQCCSNQCFSVGELATKNEKVNAIGWVGCGLHFVGCTRNYPHYL